MDRFDQSTRVLPDGGDVFQAEYHNEPPTLVIARGISALEDCTVENAPRLYDYVDPDAMDNMMKTARDSEQEITVHVMIEEYKISVDSDGSLSIHDPGPDTVSSDSE